jgi:quercetin dioxygenase-like cupin family protein
MQSIAAPTTKILETIVSVSHGPVLDLLGPTVEFTSPDGPEDFCVLQGTIPPGVGVRLHRHDDPEAFFVLSGTQQALIQDGEAFRWRDLHAGDYVHVEGGVPHAWRNASDAPSIDLIITTPRLGRFVEEMLDGPRKPPRAEDLARLSALAAKYGYWNATPEQNGAVGIELPGTDR